MEGTRVRGYATTICVSNWLQLLFRLRWLLGKTETRLANLAGAFI